MYGLQRMLGNFRFVDRGDHPRGLADASPERSFQIHLFDWRFVRAGFEPGNLDRSSLELFIGRDPSVSGTLVAGHLHALDHGVGDLGGKQANRAQRVIIAGMT